MSLVDAIARVQQLESLARRTAAPIAPPQTSFESYLTTSETSAPASTAATTPFTASPVTDARFLAVEPGSSAGARALAYAQAEIGVAEEPPGSNDGARIADYRTAVQGSAPGVPWCAYFVSWAAAQAGAPLGESGSGYGAVESIQAWAERTGRLLPADAIPSPGDLILFGGRHVGIVESVNADGTLTTVEGNTSDAVRRRVRARSEATGFVRIGP